MYIKEHDLEIIDDEEMIVSVVKEIINANQKPYEQFKNGETKVMGFFIGQAMKKLKGKADPAIIGKYVKNVLENGL